MKTTATVYSSPLPLADGTYQLPQDTPNPKPDGRIKTERASNWESWAVWPKGMRFIVETIDGVNRVYPYGAYSRLNAHDPRVLVLTQELEPVNETPSEFLERKSSGSGAGQLALAVLDKLGISLSDIQAALDALDEQKLKAQEEAARLQAASRLRAEQDSARKILLSPAECYSEGYEIGREHGANHYEGTASARGEGYSYPNAYAHGYQNGWETGADSDAT